MSTINFYRNNIHTDTLRPMNSLHACMNNPSLNILSLIFIQICINLRGKVESQNHETFNILIFHSQVCGERGIVPAGDSHYGDTGLSCGVSTTCNKALITWMSSVHCTTKVG